MAKQVFSLPKRAYNKLLMKSGEAFQKYFTTSISKYIETKTILYRRKPVHIYDFYVDIDLVGHEHNTIHTSSLNELISVSKYTLITGTAGSGKSTLIRHLFLKTIKTQSHIPIFIELRNIGVTEQPLIDSMYDHLVDFNFDLEKEHFLRFLETGRFVVFFEGFDEIPPNTSDKLGGELIKLRDKYNENIFIVTSRPDEKYISWGNFTELHVAPLPIQKTIELVQKLDYDQKTKERFIEEVQARLYRTHSSFLQNPLLTTLMLMTFGQYAYVPDKTHVFYSQAFETLFSRHDATKVGYRREMNTDLEIDDFRRVFSAFCVQTYLKNAISFSRQEALDYIALSRRICRMQFKAHDYLNDLVTSLSLLIPDGMKYTFTHRTFQEYFAALFILGATQSNRRRLIEKLELKLINDSVARLLWEIDRQQFEDEYLAPRLLEIREQTKFGKVDHYESKFLFLSLAFSFIELMEDGTIVRLVKKDHRVYDVVQFVSHIYAAIFEHKASNRIDEPDRGKWVIVITRPSEVVFRKGLLKKGRRVSIVLEAIEGDVEMQKNVVHAVESICGSFEYSMYALGKILEDQQAREESIESILLADA